MALERNFLLDFLEIFLKPEIFDWDSFYLDGGFSTTAFFMLSFTNSNGWAPYDTYDSSVGQTLFAHGKTFKSYPEGGQPSGNCTTSMSQRLVWVALDSMSGDLM